jgi:methionyl-tRNA formyltransferase
VKLVKSVRCVNVHPGYNPHNRGWYPQVFSILNDGILGATIHEIDEELDNGNIIARKKIDLFDYDTSLTAYNKVLEAEKDLLRENLIRIVDEDYLAFPPEFKGELKLKRDFNDLLEIDLDKKMTIRETLKYLRALSHGNFKNAYYLSETGKKVFVSLNLSVE